MRKNTLQVLNLNGKIDDRKATELLRLDRVGSDSYMPQFVISSSANCMTRSKKRINSSHLKTEIAFTFLLNKILTQRSFS